jgi:hypothetical protein
VYLHLGEKTVIEANKIVAILDLDNSTVSSITKDFLKKAQDGGVLKTVTNELPKSAIICNGNKQKEVYLSQISASTLQKRALKMEVIV